MKGSSYTLTNTALLRERFLRRIDGWELAKDLIGACELHDHLNRARHVGKNDLTILGRDLAVQ
jgi:hypothetical protein